MPAPDYSPFIETLSDLFADTRERAGGVAFRYHHSVQVAHLCQRLAKDQNISPEDLDCLILAALFHDIAKHLRKGSDGFLRGSHDEEERFSYGAHEDQSAAMASKLLAGHRNPAQIATVAAIIKNHAQPERILDHILHDADELSEMGYMNLWKMFSYSQATHLDVAGTLCYWRHEDRDRHLSKILTLSLPESKRLALARVGEVDAVVDRLQEELTLTSDTTTAAS